MRFWRYEYEVRIPDKDLPEGNRTLYVVRSHRWYFTQRRATLAMHRDILIFAHSPNLYTCNERVIPA